MGKRMERLAIEGAAPGPDRAERALAWAMLAATMLLWAGNAIVGRAARGQVPPIALTLLRWSGMLVLLLPFGWRGLRRDWPALRRGWTVVAGLGVLGVAGFTGLLYTAAKSTSATNLMLIQAAIPPVVLLLDLVWFRVRPGWAAVAGTTLSIIGVLLVILHGEPWALLHVAVGPGDGLMLVAVVAWSLYTVLLRGRPAVSGVSLLLGSGMAGVVVLLPLAVWEFLSGQRIVVSGASAAAVLYVAVAPSLLGYLFYNRATAVLGPGPAGQAITMMPLFGALLAASVLGETLAPYHWAGMGLILLGLLLGAAGARQGGRSGVRQR